MIPASWRRRAHILVALARSDLRIRYGRGGWQIVKWLIDPFALVGIYLLLRVILDREGEAVALTLACSVVPFQIVLLSATSALTAVSLREPILLNMRFDRMLIPPASVLTESLAFAASFLMFPIAMAFYGIGPTWALLWLPVVIAATLAARARRRRGPRRCSALWVPSVDRVRRAGAADPLLRRARARRALPRSRPTSATGWSGTRSPASSSRSAHVFLYGTRPRSGSSPTPRSSGSC